MNVEVLMNLISKQLANHYNSFKVYKGKVRQNLHLPCFFINVKKVDFNTGIKGRASLNCTFKITFLCEQQEFLYEVGEELFSVLCYINEKEFKTSNMCFEVFDGYIELFLDVTLYMKYQKEINGKLLNKLDERMNFKIEK